MRYMAGMLLLAGVPVWADTAAGLAAFKNKDYQRAYQEFKAGADAGQAEAEFDLGVMYAQGFGVLRDLNAAASWYRKAAEQGNAEAQFALGQMYAHGWGVPRDTADAIRWFQMANSVDSDGPPTDWMTVEGYGMQQDPAQAVEQAERWISSSATQGYASAMAELGKRFANGNGVAKDDKRSYFWLTLAFLHGDKSEEKLRTAEAAKLTPAEVTAQEHAAQNWKPRVASAKTKQ
jgi:TPR repeat protein